MESYLKGLNEQQLAAVQHIDGPLMIVAGAGSGKTKVLTTRIAHLIQKGVDAFHILALTFTNKAAKEMKERVELILKNQEARNLYIGTFHSVFARILRAEAEQLGYPSNFTIYDADDAKSVIKSIIQSMQLDEKQYKPGLVYNRISAAKNSLVDFKAYQEDRAIQQDDARVGRSLIGEIYEAYTKKCFQNGAMDFDDLLFKMYILLTHYPAALAKYQHRFRYIMIDEYQDTNPAQYQIIKLLGAVHENICVVGDDAQSIYSFRGATLQNILQFKDDYDNVRVIKLEQNYRSTQSILSVANKIITHNQNQIPKSLWTDNPEGEKIRLIRTMTDNEEGRFVADTIIEQKLRNHYRNQDFAILYRTNAQSRSFEESLRRMGIPYRIYGGLSFYQRKEIKDFLAYLRVVTNPRDEENIRRIINYPTRGIGKTSLDRMIFAATEKGKTLWEIIEDPGLADLKGAAARSVQSFHQMIRHFQALLDQANAYDLAFQVGKISGLVKEIHKDKSVEGISRYENIQELLNSIKEFTETPDENGEITNKDLGQYLQQISLLTDADSESDEDDVVKLMTIHASKGLEFPCVFSVGLEENLFPSMMSLYDRDDLEEERRLFYVAITRAKEKLWITYSLARYRFGNLVQNQPSRFLDEIPENHLEKSVTGNQVSQGRWAARQGSGVASARSDAGQHLRQLAEKKKAERQPHYVPDPEFKPDDSALLAVGMKVEHNKLGFGEIISMEGSPHNRIATIDFGGSLGKKKIMISYAKMRIVK